MKVEQIELGGKQYDFFVSAAVAKKQTQYLLKLQGDSEEVKVDDMLDAALDLLHQGLRSARVSRSLWYRLTHSIPSRNKLEHLVDMSELQARMFGTAEGKEEDSPK